MPHPVSNENPYTNPFERTSTSVQHENRFAKSMLKSSKTEQNPDETIENSQ